MKQIFLTITLALTILAGANAKNKIKVACVGNSITYGMTLDNPATESYPAQLQTMLGESYEVGNFGKSGATLTRNGYRPYTMQEEYKRALDFAGDIVVIHLGINDTDPRVWPHLADEFVGDYLELIASLRSANPSALFYIARLSPISDRHPRFKSGTRDWRDQIQAMIENVAEASGAQLIDFESPLIDMPWMLPDGLHPNKEGATQLAKTVYSAITGDFGGLNMPEIYTDGMVLPAGRGLTISGTANAGDKITLTIGSQSVSSTTGANGTWSIDLLPLKAGETYEMTGSDGNSSIRFTDIAAGAVWLASGQSNMQFSLKETDTALQDIQMANSRNVRFYNMKPRWMTYPGEWTEGALDSVNRLQYYQDTQWQSCTPETAADFSAIGYYFGRMLADSLNIPVGIICNAVGGSPTESWIDRTNLEHNFPDILSSPNTNDFIQPWVRDRAKENTARATSTLQRHPFHPAYLYESGIAPISSYPIDGVIWYQGESNAHNIEAHDRLFGMVIDSWRNTWKNPKLPFLFVQLSSLNRSSWPAFRNSQYWFAHNKENENVYMVISSDHGDSTDVHPRCKRPIGERLARVALRNQYGFDKLTAFAPSPVKAEFFGDSVFIHMTDEHPEHLLATSDNKAPSSFEAAYYEGIFFPANAEISSDSTAIILSCDSLPAIRHIRYGWQPFTRANLINNAGLPVSTFKISDENSPAQSTAISVESLPSLKGSNNYSKGVSAAFAGRLGNRTVVAGGANFPDVPAAKGGKKAYYDDVYYLPDGGKKWMKAKGRLPYKVAYGASFTTEEGIICA
ncbi:MAG: sialate O-acetylesterase [Muribaculaceae bacterium]|nr:sialate O-acetylesterase [Muribaculaceae bacterium]